MVRAPQIQRAAEVALFAPLAWFWLALTGTHGLNSDGRLYRAAAEAMLAGGDPWATTVQGWHVGSAPVTVVAMLPLGLLPDALFTPLWMALCTVSAVAVVRGFRLPLTWLLCPPLVETWMLGNPALPAMALVLWGPRWLGVVLRPQLAVPLLAVGRWRPVAVAVALGVVTLAVAPDWLERLPGLAQRYAAETGRPVNAWGSWLALPVAAAVGLLALRDRELAGWLIVPALFPAMGWGGYAMAMPSRSALLLAVCAYPMAGLGAVAISVFAVVRYLGTASPRRAVRGAGVTVTARVVEDPA